tara:strand:+ start:8862 stop:9041 length:180 start_codon:yes stop_codon:yes gene_type:complete
MNAYWERNIIITVLEIAHLVLNGKMGEDVCERVLDELDICDDDADILAENIDKILNEER